MRWMSLFFFKVPPPPFSFFSSSPITFPGRRETERKREGETGGGGREGNKHTAPQEPQVLDEPLAAAPHLGHEACMVFGGCGLAGEERALFVFLLVIRRGRGRLGAVFFLSFWITKSVSRLGERAIGRKGKDQRKRALPTYRRVWEADAWKWRWERRRGGERFPEQIVER